MGFYSSTLIEDRGVVFEKRTVRFFVGVHRQDSLSRQTKSSASKAFHAVVLRTTAPGVPLYGYRYYSPEHGRWISRDPLGEAGGDGLYTFVVNRAIKYVDVLGLTSSENSASKQLVKCSCDEKKIDEEAFNLTRLAIRRSQDRPRYYPGTRVPYYLEYCAVVCCRLSDGSVHTKLPVEGHFMVNGGTVNEDYTKGPEGKPCCHFAYFGEDNLKCGEGSIVVRYIHSHPYKGPPQFTDPEDFDFAVCRAIPLTVGNRSPDSPILMTCGRRCYELGQGGQRTEVDMARCNSARAGENAAF